MNIEPNRLLIFFNPPKSINKNGGKCDKKKFLVGELVRTDDQKLNLVYFCDTNEFQQALKFGFTGFYAYDISNNQYFNVSWECFSRRVMSRKRKDFDLWCRYHNLDPEYVKNLSDFALLGLTKGGLPGNNITFDISY